MKQHNYYVYIMSSVSYVLYIGVTSDLVKRVEQHKDGVFEGFSKKYQIKKLVYYEWFTDINVAIAREKELKGWRREKKVKLIKDTNPTWRDLYNDLISKE
ncbi:MAG: excinuclease ABC subunit C [Candidatus Magasanikbacteria bacterium RIFOXYD2_FULL_41_14]|uniref:Excinuclease ABC subunit C n=1 Tax=Candidatus Magasanikbacteria bacterium RIFOXYD2_FULL_41_14 TaxID=1798709 RepID=A0A1F6PG34_9BACT|nr:MAG: excinuclease ABC subunit C [Candidatus Magasanikbacteria bacterium RIFOXYD2_FULL_41_14]